MASHNNESVKGKRAVVIGGGVIGSSWAALFLANGMQVTVSDPDPDVETKVKAVLKDATPSLTELGYNAPDAANLSFEADNSKASSSAYVIQECGPEREDFKKDLWAKIEGAAPKDALLLSSSSGITATKQSTSMHDPGRLVIGHPVNPPYLIPLVEVVPGEKTTKAQTEAAMTFYKSVGKTPVLVHKELQGFVANRLQSALFKECVYLVVQGVMTVADLDQVVTESLGIRWATGGPFLSFHLSGGPGGFAAFLQHLAPGVESNWKNAGDATFDDKTKKLLLDQVARAYGHTPYDQLSGTRDTKEVAVIGAVSEA